MKNGKQRNSDNDTESAGRNASASYTDGSNTSDVVGAVDREQPTNAGQDNNIRTESIRNDASITTASRGSASVEITDGYYFTPRGTVERIPDGHYIDSSGKLRKRRKQRGDTRNASDGNVNPDRTETSGTEEFPTEVPLRVNAKARKAKKVTEAQQRLTMVAMLSVASTALFTSISLLTKHDHWNLEKTEAHILAEALNDALVTLPGHTYAAIIAIIEKWVPWINLIFVVSAIILPRIEASTKRIEETRYQSNSATNAGNARTENTTEFSQSAFDFDDR